MITFATEFPVRSISTPASLLAQVVAWLRGSKTSTVLDDALERDLDGEAPVIRSGSGEELRFRVLSKQGRVAAVGFRHDFPDSDGRLWRTEAVVLSSGGSLGQDIIKLRTQCIAQRSGAELEFPKKPYILKSIIKDDLGGLDGDLQVSDAPVWLADSDEDIGIASRAINGAASEYLPIVYISSFGLDVWPLSRSSIEWLAYQLGGVAHVLVEPSRNFSFKLRDAVLGKNVYGGAIGVIVPGRGIVRRIYGKSIAGGVGDLQGDIFSIACSLRSQMPSQGWDWSELQEQALRLQRERDRARLTQSETEALYEAEIDTLKDQVAQLKEQVAQVGALDALVSEGERSGSLDFSLKSIPEIYPGEMQDRLRLAARVTCERADLDGLDSRSRAVLSAFAELTPSGGLLELLEDLKRATKDAGRMAGQLSDLLTRHGYREKSRNKHLRLEAQAGFVGLEAVTVATTPSDARGLMNTLKQVERALGVSKLSDK